MSQAIVRWLSKFYLALWRSYFLWPLPLETFKGILSPIRNPFSLRGKAQRALKEVIDQHDQLEESAYPRGREKVRAVDRQYQAWIGGLAPVLILIILCPPFTTYPFTSLGSERLINWLEVLLITASTMAAFLVPLLILYVQFIAERRFLAPSSEFWELTGLKGVVGLLFSFLIINSLLYGYSQYADTGLVAGATIAASHVGVLLISWLWITTYRVVRLSQPGEVRRRWINRLQASAARFQYRVSERGLAANYISDAVQERKEVNVARRDQNLVRPGVRRHTYYAPEADHDWRVEDIYLPILVYFGRVFGRDEGASASVDIHFAVNSKIPAGTPVFSVASTTISERGLSNIAWKLSRAIHLEAWTSRSPTERREEFSQLVSPLLMAIRTSVREKMRSETRALLLGLRKTINLSDQIVRNTTPLLQSLDANRPAGWQWRASAQALAHDIPSEIALQWPEFAKEEPAEVVELWLDLWFHAVHTSARNAADRLISLAQWVERNCISQLPENERSRVRQRLVHRAWSPLRHPSVHWGHDVEECLAFVDLDTVATIMVGLFITQIRTCILDKNAAGAKSYYDEHTSCATLCAWMGQLQKYRWSVDADQVKSLDKIQSIACNYVWKSDVATDKLVSWTLSSFGSDRVSAELTSKVFDAMGDRLASSPEGAVSLMRHAFGSLSLPGDDILAWRWEDPQSAYIVPEYEEWLPLAFLMRMVKKGALPGGVLPEVRGPIVYNLPSDLFSKSIDRIEEILADLDPASSTFVQDVDRDDARELLGRFREETLLQWDASWKEMRHQWLLNQELCVEMVQEFKDRARSRFSETRILEAYYADTGILETQVGEYQKRFVEHRLLHRGTFLAEWPVDSMALGEGVGRQAARVEDAHIVKRIIAADLDKHSTAWDQLDAVIDDSIRELAPIEENNVVVIALPRGHIKDLLSLDKSSKTAESPQPYVGRKRGHSVITSSQVPADSVLITALTVGTLKLKIPHEGGHPLRITLEEIDEDRAEELLASNAEIAKDDSGRILSGDAAVQYLMSRLEWTTELHFRFQVDDPTQARLIELREPFTTEDWRAMVMERLSRGSLGQDPTLGGDA